MNDYLNKLSVRYPDLNSCLPDISQAIELLQRCFISGGKLLICGNGGSAADCEHIVGELMKGFLLPRPIPDRVREALHAVDSGSARILADRLQGALPAISLVSQSSLISAIANDTAAEMVFAQQVYGYGQPGDVLLAISTSGNSRSVIVALQVAQAIGLKTIGLTGETGGAMAAFCDLLIRAPYRRVDEIQERHLAIYHTICMQLEDSFFRPGFRAD